MRYKVAYNHCDCHPETCCCNPWKVVDSDGKKVTTFYHDYDARHYVEEWNSVYIENETLKSRISALENSLQ